MTYASKIYAKIYKQSSSYSDVTIQNFIPDSIKSSTSEKIQAAGNIELIWGKLNIRVSVPN